MDFFFNDTATTEIYTLSLHDALPIYRDKQNNAYFYVLKNLDTGSFIAEIFTSFYDKTDFWARINIFLNLQLVDIYFHHQYDGQFLTS